MVWDCRVTGAVSRSPGSVTVPLRRTSGRIVKQLKRSGSKARRQGGGGMRDRKLILYLAAKRKRKFNLQKTAKMGFTLISRKRKTLDHHAEGRHNLLAL